jgi:hypothetical protein
MSRKLLVGIGLAVVVGVIVVYVASGGSPMRVDSYTVEGPTTIVVEAEKGGGEWVQLTDVVESESEVLITVKRLSVPLLGRSGAAVPVYFTVELDAPLGERSVNDGFGDVLRR